jgi:hypothetical protein
MQLPTRETGQALDRALDGLSKFRKAYDLLSERSGNVPHDTEAEAVAEFLAAYDY